MKNVFYSLIVILSAILVSCGGSDKDKNKSGNDSINADSIIGVWKESGKSSYLKIEKAGELFTITSGNGLKYAYKLSAQVLTSVDGTGPIYSVIGNNELLKGSIKYTKSGGSDAVSSATNTTSSGEGEKTTSYESNGPSTSKTSASTSGSNTSNTSKISSATNATTTTKNSNPNELTIISDNMINIRQSPRASSTIIKGVSNGETFKIIERGKQLVTVSGKTDYWYKIKVGADAGWVFGAFTSLKQ